MTPEKKKKKVSGRKQESSWDVQEQIVGCFFSTDSFS